MLCFIFGRIPHADMVAAWETNDCTELFGHLGFAFNTSAFNTSASVSVM
jgi:hypothetical protein